MLACGLVPQACLACLAPTLLTRTAGSLLPYSPPQAEALELISDWTHEEREFLRDEVPRRCSAGLALDSAAKQKRGSSLFTVQFVKSAAAAAVAQFAIHLPDSMACAPNRAAACACSITCMLCPPHPPLSGPCFLPLQWAAHTLPHRHDAGLGAARAADQQVGVVFVLGSEAVGTPAWLWWVLRLSGCPFFA